MNEEAAISTEAQDAFNQARSNGFEVWLLVTDVNWVMFARNLQTMHIHMKHRGGKWALHSTEHCRREWNIWINNGATLALEHRIGP